MGTYLRRALRLARSWPLFFWSVVVILALGIGANTAVFAAVRVLLLDRAPYRDPSSLVAFRRIDHFSQTPLKAGDIAELEGLHGLAIVAGCSASPFSVLRSRPSMPAAPIEVTPKFFELFGMSPLIGRTLEAADFHGGPPSAVLSFELWKTIFGSDPEVVGRLVTIGHARRTVVGVMPRAFQPRCFEIDAPVAWVPHDPSAAAVGDAGLMMMARTTPGVSLAQANAEYDALAQRSASRLGGDRLAAFYLEPLHASRAATTRPGLVLLQSIAILLLLVACTNIGGALLLNASDRQPEFAVRAALGATPGQLVRQMFGELGAAATAGVMLGLVFASGISSSFGSFAAPVLAGASLEMGWWDVLAALALGGVVLPLVGTIPALATAYGNVPRLRRLRATLLVLQVAVTLVLLTGASVLLRSYRQAMSSPAGFQTDGLLVTEVHLPPTANRASAFSEAARALSAALEETTFVESFSVSDASPFGSGCQNVRFDVLLPAARDYVARSFGICHVSSNYFSLLRIPLVRGQLSARETGEATDVVVSDAFARLFRGEEVLGAIVRTPSRSLRVVGVVGDVKGTWLTTGVSPLVYAPVAFGSSTTVSITARSGTPAEVAADLRRAIESAVPNGASSAIEPLAQIVWRSEVKRRFYLAIAGAFAGLALLVSALGIFAAVGRVVSSRSKELAVRVALGATRAEVVRRVLVDGVGPVVAGTAAGLAGGAAFVSTFTSHPFFQTLLYKVAVTDFATYTLPMILVLGTALLACLVPLRRALLLDPARTLKSE